VPDEVLQDAAETDAAKLKQPHVEPRRGRQTVVSVCRRSTQAEPPCQRLKSTSHQLRRFQTGYDDLGEAVSEILRACDKRRARLTSQPRRGVTDRDERSQAAGAA
jgi:hypothetical protein